jgi:hypothetical protein
MPLFADRLATGLSRIRDVAGETVVYRRGAQKVTLTATIGSTREQSVDSGGLVLVVRHCDFHLPQASLILGGRVTEPQVGDTITRTDGTVWEARPIDGDRCFYDSDQYGHEWRVHTERKT